MVRVGVPEVFDSQWLKFFPSEAEIVRLPPVPEAGTHVDFWIPPLFPKEVKAMYPQLVGVKVVQAMWAGVDVLLKMLPPGITLCDAQGAHNVPTSEWAVTAILAMLKYLPFYDDIQRSGDWRRRSEADQHFHQIHQLQQAFYPPVQEEELAGMRVMIVGYGSIGRSIEARLQPFEVEIVRVARHGREGVEPVSRLRELLPSADVVVLIVPLTQETTGLIGSEELALMKQGALLVNAARGPVVVTDALVAALNAGKIRAAVDVTDPEPLPLGHPLWKAPNLLLTPHIGGASPRFLERPMRLAGEQVARYIKGEPLHNVAVDGY
ncbi:MAG TPA: 2-hydroxyacid dehydrogenase [Acidisarcina sp.]|nr:2-hydroxyacid dehydrogenase [Acidisarcina sp.]